MVNDLNNPIRISASCVVLGGTGVIIAPVVYVECGFIFKWHLAGLILGMGLELLVTGLMVFCTAQIIFATLGRYRCSTSQERAQLPRASKQDLLGVILVIGVYLTVWFVLLVLQGQKLARPGVQGSAVCLLPTLAVVLMHFVPAFACWPMELLGNFLSDEGEYSAI